MPRAGACRHMNISTERLALVPATAELIRLEISDAQALGQRLDAGSSSGRPPEEVKGVLDFFAGQMDAGVTGDGWSIYYWVTHAGGGRPRTLVGSGGFMSKPDANGAVEIGYGTLDEFQGRGYATEAVFGLVQWALSQPDVSQVIADALPENPASGRVLQKNGFADAGPGMEDGTRRFIISRGN